MDAEKEKQDDLDCSNGEGKFVNDLQQAETQVDLDSHLDEILDRKFDIHIVPWLFGIWSVPTSGPFWEIYVFLTHSSGSLPLLTEATLATPRSMAWLKIWA